MSYIAEIKVMPHKELLDPQGKAVLGGLSNLGLAGSSILIQVRPIYLPLQHCIWFQPPLVT